MTLVRYARLHPEATFDTRPGSPTYTDLRVLEESLKLNQNYGYERDIESRIFNTVRYERGQLVEGNIKLTARPNEVCEILKTHFGKVTTASLTNGYSHTFAYQDDPTKTMASFGLDLGLETLREKRVSGCAANTIVLNIPKSDEVEWDIGIIGAGSTAAAMAANSPTYSTLAPYYGADVSTAQIDGNNVLWDNLQISLDRGLMTDHHKTGSRKIAQHELGPVEVEITGDIKFTSAQLLNDFIAETQHTFDLTIRSALIGGTDYYDITFNLDNLSHEEDPGPHINRQERMVQNLKLKMLNSASGTTFSMVVNDNSATPATYTGS
jgi:hypothetical protein